MSTKRKMRAAQIPTHTRTEPRHRNDKWSRYLPHIYRDRCCKLWYIRYKCLLAATNIQSLHSSVPSSYHYGVQFRTP
ncbi:hypothetical protein V9T40_004582 [Parthenolecanium corni]|uniref:Uncharacterized protein n=1 Tax=Parthenolecanium corni TaxID=536013 RepID=A0AAN9YAJ8_9HEMI